MAITNKKGNRRRGRPVRFPDHARFVEVCPYNPFRESASIFAKYEHIRLGEATTCGEFFAMGGKTWMLSKMVKDHLIKVPKAKPQATRKAGTKSETPKTDTAKTDTAKTDTAKTDTAKTDTADTVDTSTNDSDAPAQGETPNTDGDAPNTDGDAPADDTPGPHQTPDVDTTDMDDDGLEKENVDSDSEDDAPEDETTDDTADAPEDDAPAVVESPSFIKPSWWNTFVGLATIRENIMLVGPSGCGKTFLTERLAETLNLDFGMQSCTAGMDESALAGWLIPVGENNEMVYVSSTFVRLYEKGGVMLLDEFDASEPNTAIFINAAIAGGSFFIPQRIGNERVIKHKDFICVAAANTFATGEDEQFVREKLDAATLDRFRCGIISMDYDRRVEAEIASTTVCAWGWAIREFIEETNSKYIMSTRTLVSFTKQEKLLGWGKAKWEKSYFADWAPEDIRDAREKIRQAALSHTISHRQF